MVGKAAATWFGVPQNERTDHIEGDYRTRREHTRRWELLPPSQWGIFPESIRGCGANGGVRILRLKFGFFAWTDSRSIWSTPLTKAK